MVGKQLGYCGLICTECTAYIATQNEDDDMRRDTAEEWTQKYNHPFKPEDINCDGCLTTTGRVVGHCLVCEIRKCGQKKGVENCAYCGKYFCEELGRYFQMAPVMKTNLEKVRNGLNK